MTTNDAEQADTSEQVRVRLDVGRTIQWTDKPYRLDDAGPTTCTLSAGQVRINVATIDVIASLMTQIPTTVDPTSMVSATTDRSGWLRAPRNKQAQAVELSYRLNRVLTGYRLGSPATGALIERWKPFWELTSFNQRTECMAAEITGDPDSKSALGMEKVSARQLQRLAKRYVAADYNPVSLLDLRTTAHRDPSGGLTDEQRSVVDAQLLEQRSSSDITFRTLLIKIRIAFAQRHVTPPTHAQLRRYVANSKRRHELDQNAKYRRNIAARPDDSLHQIATTHAGQFVEVDEWCIDMVGSVLGVVLHDLRLLVAIDVHTRAILAIDVIVGPATIELVLSFLFRTITPVSHRLGTYPVPDDVHLPVPDHLVADLDRLLDAKWHTLPAPPIDTIVTDQGSQFRSRHVESTLERLMISVLPMPPGRPTGKPHVEAFFNRLKDHVSALPGFTGGSPDKRGDVASVEAGILAPHEIQDLFIRFAILYNRAEHHGLPLAPGTSRHMSPNEMLVQSKVQRGAIETLNAQAVPYWFLPVVEKKIGSQPFVHNKYRFDSPDLDDLRGSRQLFHYSRIDPTRIWTFHPGKRRWIKLRGRPTTSATMRSQDIGEDAVVAALETTEWHTVSDHHDLADALASAYALTPHLNDVASRRRIIEVWHRRYEQQLLATAPATETSDEATLPGDDWDQFDGDGTDDEWTTA